MVLLSALLVVCLASNSMAALDEAGIKKFWVDWLTHYDLILDFFDKQSKNDKVIALETQYIGHSPKALIERIAYSMREVRPFFDKHFKSATLKADPNFDLFTYFKTVENNFPQIIDWFKKTVATTLTESESDGAKWISENVKGILEFMHAMLQLKDQGKI